MKFLVPISLRVMVIIMQFLKYVFVVLIATAVILFAFVYWSQIVEFMEDFGKVMIPLSIIFGAIWALFRFGCGWQAAIDIHMNASQRVLADDDNLYISAEVEVSNYGSRNVRLPYNDSNPFSLYRVTFKEKEGQSVNFINDIPVYLKSNPGNVAKSTIVRARSTERLPFFTQVSEPGLYLLTFCTQLPRKEEAKSRKAGAKDWVKWSAATYVIVTQSGKKWQSKVHG